MLRPGLFLLLPLVVSASAVQSRGAVDAFADQRSALVDVVRRDVLLTSGELGRQELAPDVLAALGRVPRHEFVPEAYVEHAYENRPLPIGYGQTISQPYIVAIMTDLIDLESGDAVLEVGTGSGYQAAILAELVETVYSIEIVPELAETAAERLRRLGYGNIVTRMGDGYHGWAEQAPFDAIVVTAAAGHVPPPLIEQLAPGGKMIIPVGSPFSVQRLVLVTKDRNGDVRTREVLPVSFVPLTGDH
jgi:protein-L-isoaspartate(D-aspartate) O-methyltransferase